MRVKNPVGDDWMQMGVVAAGGPRMTAEEAIGAKQANVLEELPAGDQDEL
jgi:hypothetical protein